MLPAEAQGLLRAVLPLLYSGEGAPLGNLTRPVWNGFTPLGLIFGALFSGYLAAGAGPVVSCEAYAWRTGAHAQSVSPCKAVWGELQNRGLMSLLGFGALLTQSPATCGFSKSASGKSRPGDPSDSLSPLLATTLPAALELLQGQLGAPRAPGQGSPAVDAGTPRAGMIPLPQPPAEAAWSAPPAEWPWAAATAPAPAAHPAAEAVRPAAPPATLGSFLQQTALNAALGEAARRLS